MRLFLASLLIASSLPVLGDGTLTVNGTTVKLNHAYATTKKNPFDKKKTDVLVLLADRELPANALNDDFTLMDAADKTHFNGVTAEIDADKQVIAGEIYSSSLKKMHSFSSVGTQKLELTTMTPTRVAGKLFTPKEDSFFDDKYSYTATFDVPISAAAAAAADAPPAAPKGKALPADGGEPRKAYDAYRKVLERRHGRAAQGRQRRALQVDGRSRLQEDVPRDPGHGAEEREVRQRRRGRGNGHAERHGEGRQRALHRHDHHGS
jgi:hypothetical protein